MAKTIFDKDEYTTTTFEESADSFTLTKMQDAQPILDQNAFERNTGANNSTRTALKEGGIYTASAMARVDERNQWGYTERPITISKVSERPC